MLAQEGYRYDSSFSPSGLSFRAQPWRRYVYEERLAGRQFWELPLAAINIGGLLLPIAGGNYFRQLPAFVDLGARLLAAQLPCSSMNFSTSMAAMHPLPAAVIAWR